ncbi:hypothetical protein [Chromobacterium haemolyticum]|uniref:hypothetical protein n=1 Tax=Chromobacterium haemolyticum TaxID=394935 RepID=UPI000593E24C|nr:hypothetical protein [Chromobacterium haemolyticum]
MEDERYTRITLRIPTDLDERLNEAARISSMSKNATIISRLERSFAPEEIGMPRDAMDMLSTQMLLLTMVAEAIDPSKLPEEKRRMLDGLMRNASTIVQRIQLSNPGDTYDHVPKK